MSQVNNNTNEKKIQHITYIQRKIIEALKKNSITQKNIAQELGLSESSVSREIARGWVKKTIKVKDKPLKRNYYHGKTTEVEIEYYSADVAQGKADKNKGRSVKHFKIFAEDGYVDFIEELVLSNPKLYSLSTANAIAKKKGFKCVCVKTLYNWVEWGLLKIKNIDLLVKVKRKPRKSKNDNEQKRKYGTSIDERPEIVEKREEIGHFEGDSIVGANNQGQILTLVDRKARIGFMFKFEEKRAENMITVLTKLKERYGESFNSIFKTITFDNGSEFAYSERMEAFGTKIYYAHAYSSWERGTNENYNGIVRRFIPKGTDFSEISESDIKRIETMINNLPRKILGWKTASEKFSQELEKIGFIA